MSENDYGLHHVSPGLGKVVRENFAAQTSLLVAADRAIRAAKEHPDHVEIYVLFLNCLSDSCQSLALLANNGKVRDMYVVARSVFETTLNLCYIIADSQRGVQMKRHAWQKYHREAARSAQSFSGRVGVPVYPFMFDRSVTPTDVDEAIKEFTTGHGTEKTTWISASIEKRIGAIEVAMGPAVAVPLRLALFVIYRHSSEILHGTLFGAIFRLMREERTGPNKDGRLTEDSVTVLMAAVSRLCELAISALATTTDLGEVVEESKKASIAVVGHVPKH